MKVDNLIIAILMTIFISSCQQENNNTGRQSKNRRIHFASELTSEKIKSLGKEKTIVLLTGGILEEHGPIFQFSLMAFGMKNSEIHLRKS